MANVICSCQMNEVTFDECAPHLRSAATENSQTKNTTVDDVVERARTTESVEYTTKRRKEKKK